MADTLIRAITTDGTVRVFCAVTTDMVNKAQEIHSMSRVAAAALGRLLTGAAMMGAAGLKQEDDSITIQIHGSGPLGQLIAVTDKDAKVRGYVQCPKAELPLNSSGKLDVGGAVGAGTLSVIRDLGLSKPYIGQIPLVSGEIAEDLTAYYAQSEQTPSAIALGVLCDTSDNHIIASGGYMIQLMPDASDETAEKLEKNIAAAEPITRMIERGMSAEDIIFTVTDGFSVLINNNAATPEYKCKCSRGKMEKALASIGKKELKAIIEEDGKAEICCHFCNKKYQFTKSELERLLEG